MLRRIGAALGARDGTGPDDDPMLGWHRREGVARGRAATRLVMIREMLRARGIAFSEGNLADLPAIDELSDDALVRAALSCHDEADFLTRLRRG